MIAKPQKEYQATYHRRQLDRGLVRVSVYVPATRKDELVGLAKRMVDKELKEG